MQHIRCSVPEDSSLNRHFTVGSHPWVLVHNRPEDLLYRGYTYDSKNRLIAFLGPYTLVQRSAESPQMMILLPGSSDWEPYRTDHHSLEPHLIIPALTPTEEINR